MASGMPLVVQVFMKGVCKFYNGKSGSLAKLQDVVIPSLLKDLPKPKTPSPRKRKGLCPFNFKWGKPQNKEVFPKNDAIKSPTNYRRMTISPAATSSSGSNSGSNDERNHSQKLSSRRPHRRPSNAMGVFASLPLPAPRPPRQFLALMRSQSMLDLQDVIDSTAMVTPRDKRMKN
ncbi:protein OXIDATIVE STRESS 3 LIKE 1-like [Miscanthus floridulus]|uniref:protein OXIDATIVE STRESS 3 LIKE 1-like n=1 Tax=Miscanthus floridulus TaxID=154761 RepID=UPI0034592CC1